MSLKEAVDEGRLRLAEGRQLCPMCDSVIVPQGSICQGCHDKVQEYVKGGGVKCPKCGDGDIEGGPWECDAGRAWQQVGCQQCGLAWEDHYELTSIMVIER